MAIHFIDDEPLDVVELGVMNDSQPIQTEVINQGNYAPFNFIPHPILEIIIFVMFKIPLFVVVILVVAIQLILRVCKFKAVTI